MKPTCFQLFRVLLISCFASGLLMLAPTRSFAASDDNVAAGLAAARGWAEMIDAGRYEQSYSVSSDALRTKIDETKWTAVLKTFRDSWGPVVTRKETNHVFRPNGFEGTEGQFLVITYDTSFKTVGELMEVVVMRWDNGKWEGAGYNGGPMPLPPGSDQDPGFAPAQSDSQTSTSPLMK